MGNKWLLLIVSSPLYTLGAADDYILTWCLLTHQASTLLHVHEPCPCQSLDDWSKVSISSHILSETINFPSRKMRPSALCTWSLTFQYGGAASGTLLLSDGHQDCVSYCNTMRQQSVLVAACNRDLETALRSKFLTRLCTNTFISDWRSSSIDSCYG